MLHNKPINRVGTKHVKKVKKITKKNKSKGKRKHNSSHKK